MNKKITRVNLLNPDMASSKHVDVFRYNKQSKKNKDDNIIE